ncbi:MAG: hypothetical protein KatS3mg105_4503 [Gemmatales bacterium]|nr:MAG: hypothetical protein KatS3mg105_4503 [Gemmatales bacterium]
MNLLCPSCQQKLNVPDQHAGQLMKCPLCANTFTVPSLPSAPAAPPVTSASSSTNTPAPPPSAPEMPAGTYHHIYTIWISPRVVGFLPAAALALVLLLMFLPWLTSATGSDSASGWSVSFSSALGMLYALAFIATFLLAAVFAVLPNLPPGSLPNAVEQFLPWRSAVVGVAALVILIFLVLQMVAGFGLEKEPQFSYAQRTFFFRLAVFCHVIAFVGALLDLWLSLRGRSEPMPKIDIMW